MTGTEAPAARALAVHRAGQWSGPAADRVVLDYEARFLRRRRLAGEGGTAFLADLPETVSLGAGDAFVLDDGRLVAVAAAQEPVTLVRGDLARLAWHIGNRHTPAQIASDHLVIRRDHVLSEMLRGLGARLEDDIRPFTPEGGAYGHGRTMGHDHGHGHSHAETHAHDHADSHGRGAGPGHSHAHAHSHAQPHAPDHSHGHDHPHGHNQGNDRGHGQGHGQHPLGQGRSPDHHPHPALAPGAQR